MYIREKDIYQRERERKRRPTSLIFSSCDVVDPVLLVLSGDPEPSSLISLILDLLPS